MKEKSGKNKLKMIGIILLASALICVGGIALFFNVFKPAMRLSKANNAYESGNYKTAIELFESCSNYKNCLSSEAYYASINGYIQQLYNDKKYEDAVKTYEKYNSPKDQKTDDAYFAAVYEYAKKLEYSSIAEAVLNYRKLPKNYSDSSSRLSEITPYLKWCRVYAGLSKSGTIAYRKIYCDEVETRVFRSGNSFCWQLYVYADDSYETGTQLFTTKPSVSLTDGLMRTSFSETWDDTEDSYSVYFTDDFDELNITLTCKPNKYASEWKCYGSYVFKKPVIR